jgi:hypothetical protein
VIPPFDARGKLPAGVHLATWDEVETVLGGSLRRRVLLLGLWEALNLLQAAGCRRVFLDGSFVTREPEPADFDACWDPAGIDPAALDPVLLDFSDGRRAQKERFGGELFPTDLAADPRGTRFLDFFQRDRGTREAKGILELDLGVLR